MNIKPPIVKKIEAELKFLGVGSTSYHTYYFDTLEEMDKYLDNNQLMSLYTFKELSNSEVEKRNKKDYYSRSDEEIEKEIQEEYESSIIKV